MPVFDPANLHMFLRNVCDHDAGGFRFYASGGITLLSTCFGVQTAFLVKALDDFDRRRLWETISRCQQGDGLYLDPSFSAGDLVGQQDETYVRWQFTFFSLLALEALQERCAMPLRFMDPFLDESRLRDWFKTRRWDNFWYCSNEIMFLMFFLVHLRDRGGGNNTAAERCLETCLDELDRRQDPETGFWGTDVQREPLNGMFGAAHVLMFYDYLGRPVPKIDRMAETTLRLQRSSGLFGEDWGGACEDYDAVEVLVRVWNTMGEIPGLRGALEKIGQRISDGSAGGGFSYSLPGTGVSGMINRWKIKLRRQNEYCYSGWKKMCSSRLSPDLWGTYFRTLSLAQISCRLDPSQAGRWGFLDLPGWGYRGAAGT